MRRVVIISDLHLGGRPHDRSDDAGVRRPGAQICHAYAELVSFVDWLRDSAPEAGPGELELVINGDIVDCLLADDFDDPAIDGRLWLGDEDRAIAKLDRIIERTREGRPRGFFDALREFLADGHRLTLTTGNHDVELTLPAVRRHLAAVLDAEGKLFQFLYDGEAYSVGRALIEHGNRYDRWNQIDHSGLRQERSVLSRRLPVDERERRARFFMAPPGTHLVIRFMNLIKDRYRFVDLLKPEGQAVIPLLLFLEPDRRAQLAEVIGAGGIFWSLRQQGLASPAMPVRPGDLGAPAAALTLDQLLEDTMGAHDSALFTAEGAVPGPARSTAGDLSILSAIGDLVGGVVQRVAPLVETARSLSSVLKLRRDGAPEQRYWQLHAALKRLNVTDSSFQPGRELPDYLDAARVTARDGEFDVVVYGHTHLPKLIRFDVPSGDPGRDDRSCVYVNTGTWCDVLRLPESAIASFEQARGELERFVLALRRNSFDDYVRRYPCYAELLVDVEGSGAVTECQLHAFHGPAHPRCAPLADPPQ